MPYDETIVYGVLQCINKNEFRFAVQNDAYLLRRIPQEFFVLRANLHAAQLYVNAPPEAFNWGMVHVHHNDCMDCSNVIWNMENWRLYKQRGLLWAFRLYVADDRSLWLDDIRPVNNDSVTMTPTRCFQCKFCLKNN